jgi:hypothetical protein
MSRRSHELQPAAPSAGPGIAKVSRGNTRPAHEAAELAANIVALAAASTGGQAGLAESLGVSATLARNFTLSLARNQISLKQILMADPRFAVIVLRQALTHVEAQIAVSEAIPAVIGVDRRARRLGVLFGRLIEAIDEALADGKIDRDEAARILKEAEKERAGLAALEQEVALAVGSR